MSRCLLVHPDLTYEVHRAAQREATALLGGPVTLVGGIDELRIFVAARKAEGDAPDLAAAVHPLCTDSDRFEGPVRGPMLFVCTDDVGDEVDVDVDRLLAWFKGYPLRPRCRPGTPDTSTAPPRR